MARPLKIPFVADVAGFLKGTRDIEGALDGVADSLDDVSRDAQESGRKAGQELSDGVEDGTRDLEQRVERIARGIADRMEQGLRDGRPMEEVVREAERDIKRLDDAVDAELKRTESSIESSTERMERSFKDAFDDVPRSAGTNLNKMATSVDDGASRAKASMSEVKQEALQNASETFSSFDGSARSLVDGVQGTFGGLVSSLGPLGMAIGAAGGLAIGAITSGMEKAKEKAEEFREKVSELTDTYREVRRGSDTALDHMIERMEELSSETDKTKLSLDGLDYAAKLAGVSVDTMAQGVAGNTELLDQSIEALKREKEQLEDSVSVREGAAVRGATAEEKATRRRINDIDWFLEKLGEERDAITEAGEAERLERDAGIQDLEREREAREKAKNDAIAYLDEQAAAAKAKGEEFASALSDAYSDASDAIADFTEDGKFNLDEYLTHMEDTASALAEYNTNIAVLAGKMSEAALQEIRELGPEAAPLVDELAGLPAGDPALRRAEQAFSTQAITGSNAYKDGLAQNMPTSVDGPTVNVDVPSTWEIQRQLNRALTGVRGTVTVGTRFIEQAV